MPEVIFQVGEEGSEITLPTCSLYIIAVKNGLGLFFPPPEPGAPCGVGFVWAGDFGPFGRVVHIVRIILRFLGDVLHGLDELV
jgi:hypothetical protein